MILHEIHLARPADDAPLDDLTDAERTGPARWIECADHPADCLSLPLDCEPIEAEAVAIRRRLVTADAADEQRLHDLLAARATASPGFERLWLDTELAGYGVTP